jgi:lysophospholipase L1-like esterase
MSIVELSLRVLYPAPIRFFYPQESYDFDSRMGHVLRPLQAAFTHDRPVRTNSLGLRDHEVGPAPKAGTVRVLALGDSQTFGNGLSLSDTWPKLLERALQKTQNSGWEVINAGIPGTDTWQHEILLEKLLEPTAPNLVVLALYVNDVVPRHRPLVGASGQTNTWTKRVTYLLKRSAVVTLLYYNLFLPWQARRSTRGFEAEEAVLTGQITEDAEEGWRQVERSLVAIKKRADERRIALLIAILPRRDQVSGRHPGRAFGERARSIADAHAVPAVDLLPSLSQEYRRSGERLFIPWDGHYSAVANETIAERLALTIEELSVSLRMRRPASR